MKVLFAVSSESISDAIIKKYQKEYKEILSYKNVYYFNAILKEIQRDKSYDRIVISEDLEPFSNNNYESIDKLIFEKLDSISDEAQDIHGKETSIILICTDRHTKGSSILVKLFGIGVYNALLGNDRSMEQVCRLINKPRSKKEAKLYYKIDTDDVNYRAENENEVSELEIQNILSHFKRLGKNTDRYADSFNNIASQYTNEQLKIIINCLPITVKGVLEEECPKYQEIMSVNGSRLNANRSARKIQNDTDKTGIKIDIIENKLNQSKMTGPIVIPSSVKTSTQRGEETRRPVQVQRPNVVPQKPATKPNIIPQKPASKPDANVQREATKPNVIPQKPLATQRVVQSTLNINTNAQKPVKQVQETKPNMPKRILGVNKNNVQKTTPKEEIMLPETTNNFEEDDDDLASLLLGVQPEETNLEEAVLPGMDNEEDILEQMQSEEPSKKGRGRPRKILDEPPKPKGKRGRPRKADSDSVLEETGGLEDLLPEINTDDESKMSDDGLYVDEEISLPGLDELNEDDEIEEETEETMLPGIEEDDESQTLDNELYVDEEVSLPGLDELNEDDEIEEETEDTMLPGIEEDDGNQMSDNSLYLEEDEEEYEDDDYEEDDEEYEEIEEVYEEDDDNEEYTEEVSLPGLDELDELDGLGEIEETKELQEVNDVEEIEQYEEQEEEELLPGIEEDDEVQVEDDGLYAEEELLPGIETDNNTQMEDDQLYADEVEETEYADEAEEIEYVDSTEETEYVDEAEENVELEEDEMLDPVINSTYTEDYDSQDNTSIESIKSNVNYSMSSLTSLITKDKKIVTFIGTTKNGTSFLINNLAALFSSLGINTAILDMTRNRNSYYVYTQNEEELRKIAYNSIEKLQNGYAEGIKVDKNLTVYTCLPNDGKDYSNAEPILSTLVQNHSLVLIDCDFETDASYFANCQEIYLVQSMDILTIQPLTAFLRELKTKGVLEPEKVRVVINKEIKVKSLTSKVIIGGMSFYNDPAMSFMTELFNKDMVKACSIPFDNNIYSKYLESMVNCIISLNGYSKGFMSKLRILGDMVYPLTSKQTYGKPEQDYNKGNFSNNMNNTLDQMKKKY